MYFSAMERQVTTKTKPPHIGLELTSGWPDYALLDVGGGRKLERFGAYVLDRPEPQALWQSAWDPHRWKELAHGRFERDDRKEMRETTGERGQWRAPHVPESWEIDIPLEQRPLRIKLAQTSFGHIGLFPEQMSNWKWVHQQLLQRGSSNHEVLNLFAYTGVASLAARAAGANVTHVDSVKQTVTWSNHNMERSQLSGIRWVVEDALKYVQREVRRGKQYTGILLDPPAYGRGPNGEKWLLDEHLPAMLDACFQLLDPKGFLLLNLYSVGYSSQVIYNLLSPLGTAGLTIGELSIGAQSGRLLPLGTFGRWDGLKS
jgi:23S rRNA (cytosine1962-C5)-methyltransferase